MNSLFKGENLKICLYPKAKLYIKDYVYRTRAIIRRSLYIFYPSFHCGLYCRAVSTTDNLCTKEGNSSIFEPEIESGFKSRAVHNGACTGCDRLKRN